MTLKLKTLLEGFAWEREAGKPLPTLADTTAAYQRKLAEQGYYDYERKRGKFGPGSRYNDEPGFDKGMYGGFANDNIVNTKWDDIVDEYNNKPGYKVESNATRGSYMAKITNTESGDEFQVKFRNQAWTYDAKIAGKYMRFDSTAALIDKFNEINGMQTEGAFDTTADVYGDPADNNEPQYSYDDPDGIDFDDENWSDPFLDDPDFMDEAAKLDYIDLDNDGNKKETMRKAAADKKSMKESVSLNQRILNNLYGSEYILKETFKRNKK
jgi:hypothetical protein